MFNAELFRVNLQEIRQRRGLTLQEFADLCGLSFYTIQSYLLARKTPTIKSLLKISNALSESPNRLLSGMYQMPTEIEAISSMEKLADEINTNVRPFYEKARNAVIDTFIQGRIIRLTDVDFGQRLRILREDAGITARELSGNCMITESSLANLEANQSYPSVSLFLSFCRELHVSPEFLLANLLTHTSWVDKRLYSLTPRQISALVDLSDCFSKIYQ